MKKRIKKIVSLILTVIILIGAAPLGAIDFASTARAADLPAYSAGEVITFGSYPQSKVTDSTIIASLDAIGKTWISYSYYSGTGNSEDGNMKPSDYMKYADVTYNGNKYRAVTFSALRPYKTGYTSSDDSFQDDNGYLAGNVYYFKYEPLTWKVLDPDEGFVMSTKAVDSQAFQSFVCSRLESTCCIEYYNGSDCSFYASDWATSSVREWLNGDFFNTAFTAAEKAQIGTTYNENKSIAPPQYDSENTYDKVFLMSYEEVLNSDFGFSDDAFKWDTARQMEPTDYALCQGCRKDTGAVTEPDPSKTYDGNACDWILRTPYAGYSSFSSLVSGVLSLGEVSDSHDVDRTDKGIVPALKFNPEAAPEQPWAVSISSTENFAASQTVTVSFETWGKTCGYYWGTDKDYSKNAFYSTSSKTVTQTVTDGGTYYFSAKGVSGSVSPAEDITFYRTDFNANGGSVSQAYVISKKGCQISIPKPEKSGSTFVEWNTKADGTGLPLKSDYIPNGEDTILYAIWRQDSATYTVTYNANGGNVSPASATVESGKSVTLPTPARSGYTCLGWALGSSATSASYSCGASYTPNADTTLYAVWKRNDTTKPTGSISSTNDVAASQTVTLSLSDNEGVAGYYWGTSSVYNSNAYTATGSSSVTKAISSSGTYYLTVKDTSGNVSSNYSITFYKTTLNANGGSVSPTSVLTKSGNSFTFPTPTGKSGYTYSGWSTSSTATSCVTTLKPTANATYYAVWINIYNLGEETYSFKNFGDSGSPGGHCFGMSITSAGYYLGELDPTVIGISSSSKLNTASFTSKVTEPICYFQHIQGNYTRNAVVAGSITYYNSGKSAEKCWNECVEYVKSHDYDDKGTLQIQIWKTTTSGHAVNFLYYKNVNGQDRLYAYDNNFPNDEVYFYLGSNKKIYESPKSTYGNNVYVETICLVDMNRYLQLSETYSSNYYVFATANTIDIEGATAYPMACGTEEMMMYEIPESASSIRIKPLVNDAEFEYINNEYSFNNIDEDTYGVLAMAAPGDDGTEMSPFSIYNEPQSVDKVTVSDMIIKYKDSVTLKPEITAADGSEYTVKYESSNQNVATVDKDGNITTLHKGETKITCTVTDEYGNSVKDTCTVTVKFQWWQWLVWVLLFGFLWY